MDTIHAIRSIADSIYISYANLDTVNIKMISPLIRKDIMGALQPYIGIAGTLLGVFIGFLLTNLKQIIDSKNKAISDFKNAIASHIDGSENTTDVLLKHSALPKRIRHEINIDSILNDDPTNKNKTLIDILRRL